VRAKSSISATFYTGKVQVKHSYKFSDLISHKLKLNKLKVQWTGWYLKL